mgnify:FL=1
MEKRGIEMTAPIKKKCKTCKTYFKPQRLMQTTCSYECAISFSKEPKNKEKYINDSKREFKKNNPSKSKLKEKVQALANKIGRFKAMAEGINFCVTCGNQKCKFDGGHFLPTSKYPAIRYYTNQIFPQCVNCNRYNGGMPKEYRTYMIDRVGIKKVIWLESHLRVSREYTIEYYQKYLKVMTKKFKKLEKQVRGI